MCGHETLKCFNTASSELKGDMHGMGAGEVGNVWSFNFFFYNRKLKRILYFACRGKTRAAANSSGTDSSEGAYNSDAEVGAPSSMLPLHNGCMNRLCLVRLPCWVACA
jgi:hypothetical protein